MQAICSILDINHFMVAADGAQPHICMHAYAEHYCRNKFIGVLLGVATLSKVSPSSLSLPGTISYFVLTTCHRDDQ